MDKPLLIGMDLGTTNAKIACYDLSGNMQAESIHPHPTRMPHPGNFEQDPRDWKTVLERGLKEVTKFLGPRSADVAGLALSTFGPGIVIVSDSGYPLVPCPTWQDERSRTYGLRLVEAVGTQWIGIGPPLMSFPAKLLWAIETLPEQVARADQVVDIKSYLMGWLTGETATDPSSGPGAPSWCEPVFDYIGWPIARLPRIVKPTEVAGELRTEIATEVGLPPHLPVFASVNDGAAATLGSGAVQLGNSVITLGTNGVCRLLVSKRLEPQIILERHLFSWPFVEDIWVCGGFTHSGAGSLQWLADLLGLSRETLTYDSLLAEAARVPPGSHGVLFMPYLAGRGTPQPDPEMRGGFVHVGLEHDRAVLTRALLEGIAFALREIYSEFERLGLETGPIRITGGGSRSRLWRQIIANVMNQPVTRLGGDSTLGDAMVAAVGLGLYPGIVSASEGMVYQLANEEPEAEQTDIYEQVYEAFIKTRDVLLNAAQFRYIT